MNRYEENEKQQHTYNNSIYDMYYAIEKYKVKINCKPQWVSFRGFLFLFLLYFWAFQNELDILGLITNIHKLREAKENKKNNKNNEKKYPLQIENV